MTTLSDLTARVADIVAEQHGNHHREAIEHAVEETLFQALFVLRHGGRLDLGYCGEVDRTFPVALPPDYFIWRYSQQAKELLSSGNLEQEAA